ncbi:acyl-CoA dehydrogenase family protein [Spiractinospora alimapuensis]|uniref:acyl-CoA dehydrogenase family protein n=1 Tax=Spiractinospora alimapuensis TaxID=2820884 RepID=UPI001F41AE50|nr:acyl-CoA dehydrogenase family protein [Spiractinospora alimapuensis]QVQ50669.1 acyl-CoA dehydrogenase family protein [Spiractinospora alimapuensis]
MTAMHGATSGVDEREARRVAESARETEWRQPSFGKELYLGRLRMDLIHPYPVPSPDARDRGDAFLDRLRRFCRDVDAQRIEHDERVPDATLRELKELGALGMKIPVEYGGLGLGQVYYNKALVLLGSASPALSALVSAHQSIGVPQPLMMFGTPEQKSRYLPRCASSDISAFLLTEPDVGSDPARLGTTAVPTEDGAAYVLDGVKLWTTNGVVADLLVVMARVPESPGHPGGISAFVVEAESAGITVENRNRFMGLRGLENGVTRFHNVRVPAENLIGREGRGLKIALATLNTGRLSLPAMCVGAAKLCTKYAKEWGRERVQWGRPIGEHEEGAKKIAFITASTYALEAMLDLAGQMADDGHHDIRIEAAIAKLYASELAYEVADELVQLRGGRGYETADSLVARGERGVPAEQLLRDLRINRIFEGSTEIMHLLVAREAVDAHLSVAGDIISPDTDRSAKARAVAEAGKFYARWLPTLAVGQGQLPTGFTEFGPLAGHLRFVERSARRLARSTFYAMTRWQGALEHRQAFLGRVVDIGAELFAISAVCSRALRDGTADPSRARSAYELADAFAHQARARVDTLFTALWTNSDETDRKLSHRAMDDHYDWLEDGTVDPSVPGPAIAPADPGPTASADVHRRID